jgi:hypothetical protein
MIDRANDEVSAVSAAASPLKKEPITRSARAVSVPWRAANGECPLSLACFRPS